jgi:hypothetical protein
MCKTIIIEDANLEPDPDEPILSGWMTPGYFNEEWIESLRS